MHKKSKTAHALKAKLHLALEKLASPSYIIAKKCHQEKGIQRMVINMILSLNTTSSQPVSFQELAGDHECRVSSRSQWHSSAETCIATTNTYSKLKWQTEKKTCKKPCKVIKLRSEIRVVAGDRAGQHEIDGCSCVLGTGPDCLELKFTVSIKVLAGYNLSCNLCLRRLQ